MRYRTLLTTSILLGALGVQFAAAQQEPTENAPWKNAYQQAKEARDVIVHSKEKITLQRIGEVNALIDESNSRIPPDKTKDVVKLQALIAEHLRNFTVFVYQSRQSAWVRDDTRSFVTNRWQEARDHAAQIGNYPGWTATTNAQPRDPLDNTTLPAPFQKLVPLHQSLGDPQPGDWLAAHDEAGQSYRQYVGGSPIRATQRRRVICIQPLGDFTEVERKIIGLTSEYLGILFQLPFRVSDDLPLTLIPASATRQRADLGGQQILSTYVLNQVLKPRLPDDAVVYIAFTASDLWPGEGWNFVFGQASLADRVGVWSIHRFGKPEADRDAYLLTLRRTLATAAHETGHMFSLAHCTYFDCCMCGSNSLPESDRRPLWFCPHCLAKLCHATGADPAKRFKELANFAQAQSLDREAAFWRESWAALRSRITPNE